MLTAHFSFCIQCSMLNFIKHPVNHVSVYGCAVRAGDKTSLKGMGV